ncbi:MAG: hypothetical protein ACI9JN_000750 [Bacteroidia bacterium]|jgi:hypothetical protein
MKLFLTSLLALIGLCASAQIHLTDSVIHTFLQKEINQINAKMYRAAIEGKVSAYINDSFATRSSKEELVEQFSYEYVTQVYDQYGDPIDSTYTVQLSPDKDFTGMKLTYEQEVDLNDFSIRYVIKGIGPNYMVRVGILQLGSTHLFILKMSEVETLLSDNELLFLKSVLAQNSLIGDFRLYTQRFYDMEPSDVPFEYALRSVQSETMGIPDVIDYSDKMKLLSPYNRHVPSIVMSRVASHQEKNHPANKILFKDINLTIPYDHPASELAGELITAVEDEYGDLKDTVVLVWAPFFEKYDYVVWQSGDKYIFDFTIEQFGYAEDNGHIYMSFDTVKSLFPKQDQIVWEAFLKDLFSE